MDGSNDFEDARDFLRDFDRHARDHGGWFYDNGWRYKDEFFGSAYMRDEEVESGRLVEYLLMLRDGKTAHRTIILHQTRGQLVEIWSGLVTTKDDFDGMNAAVDEYVQRREGAKRRG